MERVGSSEQSEKAENEKNSAFIDVHLETLLKRIYYAARDGMAIALYAMISEKSPEEIEFLINQKVVDEDGQHCTPLIIAARCGNERVIKTVVEKFNPDLEVEGIVKFDGCVTEGASALWCAAGAGRLNIVKILVKAGADINHSTKNNSTPLRAACFDGRSDIVNYLIQHGADVNIANKFNNTCLMIASYKGHIDVVKLLLENGARPDEQTNCGATALHFASECGHLQVVLEILKYSVNIARNNSGMTPLISAAERMQMEVVGALILRLNVPKKDVIDAFELMGASFANDKNNYDLDQAYAYLHKAMRLRYSDSNNIILKELQPPIKAYQNWRESETLERLESIRYNNNALHMEALTIRERILGPYNFEVPHQIIFRGAVFADNARFDRCLELWLHALQLRQMNNVSVVPDLLQFAQVFSQMIHVGVEVDFQQVVEVLDACVAELVKNRHKVEHPEPNYDYEQFVEELESNVITTLYIVAILTKFIITPEKITCAENDVNRAYSIVRKLCVLNIRMQDGQTPLHLAVNPSTPVDDFHTNDVCKFPCAYTAKLLIQCGANVNAMDNQRNTPLHIIVGYQKSISDFLTLHTVIMTLIEQGAHMDIVNSVGKTPYNCAATGVAEIILRTQLKISLKCMAAKAVKTYNIPYIGFIPGCLENFIELHGTGIKQG